MNITPRNVVATILVAAVVVPYAGYLVWGEMPFIKDPRGMAATGLILGLAAVLAVGRDALGPGPLHRTAQGFGIVTLGAGTAALLAETSEVLLAVFIVGIVCTWALGEMAAARDEVPEGRPMVSHR
jgi:hypothetical protein